MQHEFVPNCGKTGGWENMKEENGEDIPFNNQNLKDMMEDSYWLKAVSTSYTASLIEDKVKN